MSPPNPSNWVPPNPQYPPPKAGEPALHRAARVGEVDAIRALVGAGQDINAVFDIGLDPGAGGCPATPLMVAAGSGDGASVETVRALLELGADARIVLEGRSAASFAAEGLLWNYRPGGDAERLRAVLNAGAPLKLEGTRGRMLLWAVAQSGDPERLRVLLDRGASPHAFHDPDSTRSLLSSPDVRRLPEGVKESLGEANDWLPVLEASFKVTMKAMVDQLASAPSPFEIPLFGAAEGGSAECVNELLKRGADPMQVDSSGLNALAYASTPDAVRALVRAGARPEVVGAYGRDALDEALERLDQDPRDFETDRAVIRALIDAGASVEGRDTHGCTRLWRAAFRAYPSAVEFLLELGHPPVPPPGAATALHAICWQSDDGVEFPEAIPRVVETLLNAGVDPNARDESGNTPLHEAVAGDGANLVAAEILMRRGANADARNNDGETPLAHVYETQFGYEKVVPFLLEHGANPLIPNNRGKNALDLARQMMRGENPDWRVEQWQEKGGPPCGWKAPAEAGDQEYRMLALMEAAADRFR
jgi:ankyrin repeat protein